MYRAMTWSTAVRKDEAWVEIRVSSKMDISILRSSRKFLITNEIDGKEISWKLKIDNFEINQKVDKKNIKFIKTLIQLDIRRHS